MIRKAACLLFTLFAAVQVFCQRLDNIPFFKGYQSHYGIYHWTTSNGLPQSHIAGITQTQNELVYIATNNGVCSTDGRRFNRLTGPEFTYFSPLVTAISHLHDTVVWASNKEVVVYFDRKVVASYSLPRDFYVQNISFANGQWYFLGPKGILALHRNAISPVFLCENQLIVKGKKLLSFCVTQNAIYSLVSEPSGKNWIFGYNLKTKRESAVHIGFQIDKIFARDNQLYAFDGKNWSRLYENGNVEKTDVPSNTLSGTLQSGLFSNVSYYYNGSDLLLKTAKGESVLHVEAFLHGNQVNTSFVDHSGNLWLGTSSYGLFLFRRYPFSYVFPTQQETIRNSASVFADSDGIIWIDNDCREVIAADPKRQQIVKVLKNVCSKSGITWSKDSIAFFGNGNVHHWYNKKTGKTSVIQLQLPVTNCYRFDKTSILLSSPGKLLKWNGKNVTEVLLFQHSGTTANEFCRLADGTIIAATSEGIYRCANKTWKKVAGAGPLQNVDCRSLQLLESKNKLLIGTAGQGIILLDLSANRILKLKRVPTSLQFCWSILEDRFGQLWITSNNGVIQLDVDDLLRSFELQQSFLQFNRYQYESGIDNAEFNSSTQDKAFILPSGVLVFSGLGGPILADPQDNRWFNASLSDIIFERILLNGKDVSPLIPKLNLMEGDFAQFTFTISAFSSERILSFEYRIKGFRNQWTTVNSRQVMVDNLPAGDYQLEIRLRSQKRIICLPMHVEAKYPLKWLWWCLSGLAIMGGIAWILLRINRYIQQRRLNQAIIEQRLKVLEAEALRSQMNPHFIFNCLNTIQFLFMAGNVEKANKYLSDFSALMRLTLELLRKSLTTLETELRAIDLYVELEKLQFDEGFEYRLVNNLKTPLNQVQTPSLFLQIFVENAIVHGLRDISVKNPVLTLILEEEGDLFRVRICDNGPGFGKSSSSETHNSVGTGLALERFRLKNEIYDWDITYSTHEYPDAVNDIHTEVCIAFSKLTHKPEKEE